ncbi:TonB-dependent copper receptor [Castellaniella defragrans]|uniref:TonB-dependent copper receptor n=1 Tax=Castellaniella defragrans TaxID=75697 RepID=UPI0023F0D4A4|nr:TonB-dependent copper receptor [Castellaniella defragrans]
MKKETLWVAGIPVALMTLGLPRAALSQPVRALTPVVVTAPAADEPLVVRTDPKAPRQPVPAHDGADFLKSIPGFSVIRKGGTDGDPVLRGFSGSRLGILLDGQEIYGGCGGRMDPPTAYVYPESYDRVTVLKGPQSVRYGAGQSAGVVLFEREVKRMESFGWKADGSLTLGSFGRNDQMADVLVGGPQAYVRAGGTRAQADDYEDGDGNRVHSEYLRWSSHAAIGLTPDDKTRIELSAAVSDGRAAYADRGMDGSKFKRENVSLMFERKRMGGLVDEVEGRVYYNYVDHVMDNYTLRSPSTNKMGQKSYMASNPDRRTTGGRLSATLRPAESWEVVVGADAKQDVHRARGSGMQASADAADAAFLAASRVEDMRFEQHGVFSESTWFLTEADRVVGGLRVDWIEARDKRAPAKSATAGRDNDRTLTSGFLRYERDYGDHSTWYAGLGHSERFPDYWELMKGGADGGNSAFLSTKPEKLNQLDVGTTWRSGPYTLSASAFYSRVDDYILIDWNRSLTRNVDATVMGGELDAAWQFHPSWQGVASLSYVYGKNRTDGTALAQQPPLEARLGLNYAQGPYSAGILWRLVAAQNRYDAGMGGIAGKDLGATGGFGVLSLNAGWRPAKSVLLTAGVDNVLNKTYAEHLSKSGVDIPGSVSFVDTRLNEPGRVFWLKAQIALD